MGAVKEFTLRHGLTVQIEMSSVTAWTDRLTVTIVSDLAANCSTLWFQQLRRSCLRNDDDDVVVVVVQVVGSVDRAASVVVVVGAVCRWCVGQVLVQSQAVRQLLPVVRRSATQRRAKHSAVCRVQSAAAPTRTHRRHQHAHVSFFVVVCEKFFLLKLFNFCLILQCVDCCWMTGRTSSLEIISC